MRNRFQLTLAIWSLFIGAFLLLVQYDGDIVLCIMCGSVLKNTLGIISILIGAVGINNAVAQRRASRG